MDARLQPTATTSDLGEFRTARPHLLGTPLTRCPECRGTALDPVVDVDAETVNFRCRDCGRCWHVELGFVHRVDPHSCSGCPFRPECVALFVRDH
jgi:Pyruvate/2-oxoacid:ferredoxin oxidoreductase delta subunit